MTVVTAVSRFGCGSGVGSSWSPLTVVMFRSTVPPAVPGGTLAVMVTVSDEPPRPRSAPCTRPSRSTPPPAWCTSAATRQCGSRTRRRAAARPGARTRSTSGDRSWWRRASTSASRRAARRHRIRSSPRRGRRTGSAEPRRSRGRNRGTRCRAGARSSPGSRRRSSAWRGRFPARRRRQSLGTRS